MYPNRQSKRQGGGRTHRVALLIAAVSLCAAALPLRAQDAAPDDAPAADPGVAAPAKPKPKRVPPKPKPVERRTTDTKPADAKPADTKPAEAATGEVKPAETKPAETKPAAEGALLVPSPSPASATWPNGAASVSESYGDWTMTCTREGGRPSCAVLQTQGDRRTGKRQFSIELRTPRDGRAEGMILMPFGLQIEPGVTFKIDDRVLGKGAPYTSCVSDGCLVSISLPTVATDTMQIAQNMSVSGVKPDAKEPAAIQVPLTGFAAAFARAIALGG